MTVTPYEIVSRVTARPNRVVTVGTFDGVHLGHFEIVQRMKSFRQHGDTLSAITFDPHPREVLRREAIPKISTLDERAQRLHAAGVDEMIVIPFDESVAHVSAASFVEDMLYRKIGFHTIVVGHDHRFGRNGEGDENMLRSIGRELGFDVVPVEAVYEGQLAVSSSEIRAALSDRGDVALAARMLGRRYHRAGIVVRGDGRGRTIGFPTANMRAISDTIIPRSGVFAVLASTDGLTRMPAVMNIGVRPTFGGKVITEEVHLLDWDGDLYDQRLTVEFVDRLRDERKFESIEALVNQLSIDLDNCKKALKSV